MPTVDDPDPRADRVYRETLMRAPIARERGAWTARLPAGLLRWRLRRKAEFRLGVAPFRRSAAATLHAIGGAGEDARDLQELHDRWRQVLAGAPARWRAPSPPMRAEVEDRARAVDDLFQRALRRSPDERTRRLYLARWILGLDDRSSLLAELHASDERARLLRAQRLFEALSYRLAELDGSAWDVDEEDGRLLRESWRRFPIDFHDPCLADAPEPAAHLAERARAVDALFAEVLLRPPDAATRRRYLLRWSAGLDDLESLRAELRRSPEHQEVISPLVAIVREVHERYVHRPPTEHEVKDAVDRARTSLPDARDLAAAIADGTVRRKLGIRPLKLEMDVTTQCNLRCTMCYFSDPIHGRRERVDIGVDDFRRLARQAFPYCGLVSLSFGTEPLLHPRLEELLEIAAEEEVPWRYVITNGLLLDERLIEAFVRVPLHGFSVSIDAATAPTYERIRNGGRWDRLMANLRALQAAKRRAGSEYPRLTFNFVMMRSNLDELPALVRLAHELQAEGVSATHLTSFEGLDLEDEQLHTEPERCNAVLAATRAEALRLGIPVALPEPFDLGASAPRVLKQDQPVGFLFPASARAGAPCPFPWQFVGIDPYGKVVPCGSWYTQPPMGDIRAQAFADIWDSPAWRELRSEHAEGELRPLCLECPAAGMGSCDNPRAFGAVRLGLAQGTPRAQRPATDAP